MNMREDMRSRDNDSSQKSLTFQMSKLLKAWPDINGRVSENLSKR